MIGNKVVIIGVSAVGKSTFARAFAQKTGRAVTHMDTIMWEPGWNYVGAEVTARTIREIAVTDNWVIEGYITKAARADLFQQADSIIYLDYPRWIGVWRYLRRSIAHKRNARVELPGSPDTFSFKTAKLIWQKGEVWKLNKLLLENDWEDKIIRLHSPKEAASFIQNL